MRILSSLCRWPQKTQVPETRIQPNKPKVSGFSRRTTKASKGRIRKSSSSHHRRVHSYQKAPTLKKIGKPGRLGEWHLWTGCHTIGTRVGADRLGSHCWAEVKTLSQYNFLSNSGKPKLTCFFCNKPRFYQNPRRWLKKQKVQTADLKDCSGNNKRATINSNSNSNIINKNNKNRKNNGPKTVYAPCQTCGKTNHSTEQRDVILEPTQKTNCLPGTEDQQERVRLNQPTRRRRQKIWLSLQPKLWTRKATAYDWHTGDHQNKTSSNHRGCMAATSGDNRGNVPVSYYR